MGCVGRRCPRDHKPIPPDLSLSNPLSILNCARWISPYSSRPSIIIIHSIAASLKSAIFKKLSWLKFPIPSHPRLFASLRFSAAMSPLSSVAGHRIGEILKRYNRTYIHAPRPAPPVALWFTTIVRLRLRVYESKVHFRLRACEAALARGTTR